MDPLPLILITLPPTIARFSPSPFRMSTEACSNLSLLASMSAHCCACAANVSDHASGAVLWFLRCWLCACKNVCSKVKPNKEHCNNFRTLFVLLKRFFFIKKGCFIVKLRLYNFFVISLLLHGGVEAEADTEVW